MTDRYAMRSTAACLTLPPNCVSRGRDLPATFSAPQDRLRERVRTDRRSRCGSARCIEGRGRAARRCARLCRHRGRAAARSDPRRPRHQRGDGAGQGRPHEAARHRRQAGRRSSQAIRKSQKRRGRRARASSTSRSSPRSGTAWCARSSKQGAAYGRSAVGKGETVNVEYVSANPTGPDARRPLPRRGVRRRAGQSAGVRRLRRDARILHQRCRRRRSTCSRSSAFLRYREALGEDIGEIPEGLYPGDYLKPVGAALAKEHGKTLLDMPEERWLPLVRDVRHRPA